MGHPSQQDGAGGDTLTGTVSRQDAPGHSPNRVSFARLFGRLLRSY